ncbi:zinc finger protein 318-like isoform X3 [Erythrolamprus reginae]|uniref:zinc finger protein 318-like isoform X3 n=1 Tax=Erythrolamprus reginae TaxID=121349 RepID=UPI00396CD813
MYRPGLPPFEDDFPNWPVRGFHPSDHRVQWWPEPAPFPFSVSTGPPPLVVRLSPPRRRSPSPLPPPLVTRLSPPRRSPSPRLSSERYSPSQCTRSPEQRAHSPGRHSGSPGWRSRSRHPESSVEQNLEINVGNDGYGIDTPERKILCDRLGSPVDILSDMDRDDLADGPIFSRSPLHHQSLERYPSHQENQAGPFNRRHDEDHHNRDVFLHQSDYSMHYEDKPRENDREGELHRRSFYALDDRGREPKRPRYDRNDRLHDMNMEPQGFLSGTQTYRKRSFSRSPSPTYLNEDFHEVASARRKRKEEEPGRNLSRELSGNSYVITNQTGSTNQRKFSESQYLYSPDEAPEMPQKPILKKHVDDHHSVQPQDFSSSSSSIKEPPLLSNHSSLPRHSRLALISLEVDNFLKQFNKSADVEPTSKETQGSEPDWKPFSGPHKNTLPAEQNSENFLKHKEPHRSTSESVDHPGDFLLPRERASQDGSGFSRICDDNDCNCNTSSPSTQKLPLSDGKESVSQKVGSPLPSSVKPESMDESGPQYEKIYNLLKTIGLDIGVAEIGKLAARTQERLHGKKSSRSPDRYSGASSKPEMWEKSHNRSKTYFPESNQKYFLSPTASYPLSKVISPVTESEHSTSKMLGRDNPIVAVEQSVPPLSLIPSAPPSLPNLSPSPTSVSQYRLPSFSPFSTPQLPQNYPPTTMPPPGYDPYGHYMAYAASDWPMYVQQTDPELRDTHGRVPLTVTPNPTRPNLIETVSTAKGTSDMKRDGSGLVRIATVAPYSKLHSPFSQPSVRGSEERIADEESRASRKQKVVEEIEKLKAEEETGQKTLHELNTELNRLSNQEGKLLRKKQRKKDGHKDPLPIKVNQLQDNIAKEIVQLKMNAGASEKKQSELDKTLDPSNRPLPAKTQNEAKEEVTKEIDKIPVPAQDCLASWKPLVLICGNSTLFWAGRRAANSEFGTQLKLSQWAKVQWLSQKFMSWEELVPLLFDGNYVKVAPTWLVIHLGGDDIGQMTGMDLFFEAMDDLQLIKERWPDTQLVWSDLIRRKVWRNVENPVLIDKARRRVNKMVGKVVLELGGQIIQHPDIHITKEGLYRDDGVRLTDEGNNIFLSDLQRCLQQLVQPGGSQGV